HKPQKDHRYHLNKYEQGVPSYDMSSLYGPWDKFRNYRPQEIGGHGYKIIQRFRKVSFAQRHGHKHEDSRLGVAEHHSPYGKSEYAARSPDEHQCRKHPTFFTFKVEFFFL